MALDLHGFEPKENDFGGLYQAANSLEKRGLRQDQLNLQREGKRNAAGTFLNNYLDKKDFLTGTNYDPEIVRQLQETIQEGAKLAASGADTPTIMMALGPKVNRLNEYATKAKLIDQSIKDSVGKLKAYKGYNPDTLSDEAKKLAFYDGKGQLKDITTIDPNQDWITEVVKLHPEKVTSAAGLDDFVSKTPMSEYSREVQTMFGGRKRNVKYDAKAPFYMDIARDEKGGIQTDLNGNPVGLDVHGETIKDDRGQTMVNPETGEPYKVMAKASYNAIMQHNPDIADYVRGQVNQHFKQLGVDKIPEEGTSQWDLMARSVLRDELKTRDKSFFKTQDRETKTAPVTRIELGYPAYAPKSSSASSSETQIRDVYGEISGKIKSSGKQLPLGLGVGIEMNQLSATAQTKVLEHANKLIGSGMTQSDIMLVQTPEGVINMVDPVEGKVIAPIDFGDINMSAQPGIKEKRKVIEQANKTYEHNGKKFTHDQVEKAAQASGMSVEDYIKKAGLK